MGAIWSSLYNLFDLMANLSFAILAASEASSSLVQLRDRAHMLRLVLGCMLVGVHVWCRWLVFRGLGRPGWFYADFFDASAVDRAGLHRRGIYRYLADPECILGQAAYWGLGVLSGGEWRVYLMAALYHCCALALLYLVERPHRRRLYGRDPPAGSVAAAESSQSPAIAPSTPSGP